MGRLVVSWSFVFLAQHTGGSSTFQHDDHSSVSKETRPTRLRLAFFSNQLSPRGTEGAIYDYADFSETILGHSDPLIFYNAASRDNHGPTVVRFEERFRGNVIPLHHGWSDIDAALKHEVQTALIFFNK